MIELGRIDQYITEIDASQHIEDVCSAVQRHIVPQGFEKFSYMLTLPPNGARRPLYITNYPQEWTRRYVEKHYISEDLVSRFSASTLRPFLWHNLNQHYELTQSQKLVFNEAGEFHLRSGAAVPIHGPGAAKASFAVANDMPEAQFAALFAAQRHELHLVATYAHERMMQIGLNDAPPIVPKLTSREIEVMTWSARGKTAWEIAEILNLSEETIRDHVKHSCRKLNTSNKTHAIAVALLFGLIVP
jgi:DNA-binding CsgD family transcriptional regulator